MEPTKAFPTIAPPPPSPATSIDRKGLNTAHFLLWFSMWFLIIFVGFGLEWDRVWHSQHTFDTFFTPPHIFTYTMVLLTAMQVMVLTFNRNLRQWFGPGLRVPLFPFEVPGALFILGAGFVTLAIAGTLDSIWHSAFGLDETGWSTPHAMLGWGLLMVMLGFIACHLALRPHKPLRWYAVLTLGYLTLAFSLTPFLGPFDGNISQDTIRLISTIPVLLAQPPAEHTFRIYKVWNLTRENPIFVPLIALWAGTALAFVRRLDRRVWLFAMTVMLATLAGLGGDRNLHYLQALGHINRVDVISQPLPLLIPGLLFALLVAVRVPERLAWGVFGLIFGFLCAVIWVPDRHLTVLLALIAIPMTIGGSYLGQAAFAAVERPTERGRAAIVLAGVAVPFITGMVDLYVRMNTP